MILLETQNLCFLADGKYLLRDLSFNLQAGEIHAVVGPNGAGKSTLLKCIAGDAHRYSGSIRFNAQFEGLDREQRARAIAVLPQQSTLSFPFSVEEVIALGRIPHSTGKAIDLQIVQEAMQALEIQHLAQSPYPQLSGGEKQRVQLARVMAQVWRGEDAALRLLLLDEPTSALDIGHQQQLMQLIRKFSEQGVAVLMIEHDINIAASYSDKLIALLDGHCIAQGKTQDVLTEALLKKLFNTGLQLITHPKTHRPYVLP